MTLVSQDAVVEANRQPTGTELRVCQDIAGRQAVGIIKYGLTVEQSPLKLLEWMRHEYEEQLDAVVYKRRQIEELEKLIADGKLHGISAKEL